MKRTIQTSKPGYVVGIEFDHRSIRAARLSSDGRGGFAVSALEEQAGEYGEDVPLMEGLRQVKTRLGGGLREPVISCLAGKQVFATQMGFRRLTGDEMEQALRLELRKIVHFEVATSALDYEVHEDGNDSTAGECEVTVALASNTVLSRHMSLLDRAGLRPTALDVLPLAVANALWAWKEGSPADAPSVALHVGPLVSTIVIDGEYSPFFNRSIPFAAEEVFGEQANPADGARRIQALADEVARSLNYYEKNFGVGGFQELALLGDRLDGPGLADALKRQTGMRLERMDLAGKLGGTRANGAGRFDLAIALALRGD